MIYQLKKNQESFEIVDGLDAGRRYLKFMTYTELPKGYEDRFEPVPEPKVEKAPDTVEDQKPRKVKKSS